ncbi:MAG: GNAT family N-acetyltransferase [Bacillota bacterium]
MPAQYDIQKITTQQTLPLRKKVLKPFLSEEECVNPGDDLSTTFHFGLFVAGEIVSIATFIQESHSEFSAEYPYRLRGMATDQSHSGQGYGKALLSYGVEFLKGKGCDLLWFNARQSAFPFYEKLTFYYHGPLFEMKDIGPHKVMYKTLIPR